MRVLIADDHAVVRKGLRTILSEEFEDAEFGEAENTQEALLQIWEHTWDLVILDITMPGRSGLEVLREARATRPKLPILVLSIHPEDQYGPRLLKAGAAGYLTKESAPNELVIAVRKVLSGGRYVSQSLAEKLAADLDAATTGPLHEQLSDRELQVVRLMASGKPAKEISIELSLSVKTVSTYRTRALRKLRLKTNAEVTRYAIDNRLVP